MKHGAVAVGGSGARVLEAYAYLHALGLSGADVLSVIVIDEDADSIAAARALRQFDRIRLVAEVIRKEGPNAAPLPFRSGVALPAGTSPIVDTIGRQGTFGGNIGYPHLPTDVQDLVTSLFSESERQFGLLDGYQACANVGSLDLRRFLEGNDPRLTQFKTDIAPQGDGQSRAVVFGSLFGGTGESGLPIVPGCIQDSNGWLRTGAVMLAPYFTVRNPSAESKIAPNFSRFRFATRAALEHYADALPYQRMYLLGRGAPGDDDRTNDSFVAGGLHQDNDPHEVELAGAMCGADFFRTGNIGRDEHTVSRWLTETESGWEGIPLAIRLQLRERLTQLYTAAILHCYFLEPLFDDEIGQEYRWFDQLRAAFPAKALVDERTRDLGLFFREFLTWADTLNGRSIFRSIELGGTGRRRDRKLGDKPIPADDAQRIVDTEALSLLDPLNTRRRGGAFARLLGEVDKTGVEGGFRTPLAYYLALLWGATERFCQREHPRWTTLRAISLPEPNGQ